MLKHFFRKKCWQQVFERQFSKTLTQHLKSKEVHFLEKSFIALIRRSPRTSDELPFQRRTRELSFFIHNHPMHDLDHAWPGSCMAWIMYDIVHGTDHAWPGSCIARIMHCLDHVCLAQIMHGLGRSCMSWIMYIHISQIMHDLDHVWHGSCMAWSRNDHALRAGM
jgi:hypothetical protein